jgi:Domain of unknown function DUF11
MRKLIGVFVATLFVVSVTVRISAQDPVADLEITGSGNYSPGSYSTYYSTATNMGPDTATSVVVSGGISGGQLSSVTTGQGSCTINGDSFTCDIGALDPDQTVSVSMLGYLPNFGSHPNNITYCGGYFSVGAATSDPDSSNNSVSICVVVPGGGCSPPYCGGGQCSGGTFWCASYHTCLSNGSFCP